MNAGERDIVMLLFVKGGGGEEGERERERAGRVRLHYSLMMILQPWILRLIRNADAFADTRPTLLFRPM
jgi:hypothetical protein